MNASPTLVAKGLEQPTIAFQSGKHRLMFEEKLNDDQLGIVLRTVRSAVGSLTGIVVEHGGQEADLAAYAKEKGV